MATLRIMLPISSVASPNVANPQLGGRFPGISPLAIGTGYWQHWQQWQHFPAPFFFSNSRGSLGGCRFVQDEVLILGCVHSPAPFTQIFHSHTFLMRCFAVPAEDRAHIFYTFVHNARNLPPSFAAAKQKSYALRHWKLELTTGNIGNNGNNPNNVAIFQWCQSQCYQFTIGGGRFPGASSMKFLGAVPQP